MLTTWEQITENMSDALLYSHQVHQQNNAQMISSECDLFPISNLKYLKMHKYKKVKLPQLCADGLPCVILVCDISVGFQAVVNTTPGIITPN